MELHVGTDIDVTYTAGYVSLYVYAWATICLHSWET